MTNEIKKLELMKELTVMGWSKEEILAAVLGNSTPSTPVATPQVAFAEVSTPVVTPTPTKKTSKILSREDAIALYDNHLLSEETDSQWKGIGEADLELVGKRGVRYTAFLPSDLWVINHINITKNYSAKWSSKMKCYMFENTAYAINFLRSYEIKKNLTEEDRKAIEEYNKEKNRRKAEYYANLAK